MARNIRTRIRGWTVFIVLCADGTYSSGFCSSLKKRVAEINLFRKGYYFNNHPERVPVRVVYKETGLGFKEAFAKGSYLKDMTRRVRVRLIETGRWPIGGPYREYIETGKLPFNFRKNRQSA